MARSLVAFFLLTACTASWSGTISVPNTFQSGTPALAAEVNANFQALVDAVNAQQTAISQLQSDLSAANATISQLQTDLAAAESAITSNDNAIVGIQSNSVLALDGFLTLEVDSNGYDTARFDSVNVQVTNGLGATNGIPAASPNIAGTVNGLGNLIIGYNESFSGTPAVCSSGQFDNQTQCESNFGTWAANQKTGSHNLVIGVGHNYTRHGGLLAGIANTVNRRWASASGGIANIASGVYSVVSAGSSGTASGLASSVSGGFLNIASEASSTVSGGRSNLASGPTASVSGGNSNEASGLNSSVSGGARGEASGLASSVSGGDLNEARGSNASVTGGENNTAAGTNASVSGGRLNFADGLESSISGGRSNSSGGAQSTVGGGAFRLADGTEDWAAGELFQDN